MGEEERGRLERLATRTEGERLAFLAGFAEAVNLVHDRGLGGARRWLWELVEAWPELAARVGPEAAARWRPVSPGEAADPAAEWPGVSPGEAFGRDDG